MVEEDTCPNYDTDGDEVAYEELPPDNGESLVIQRVLNIDKSFHDESWLRHNIFRTKCTAKGKVCMMIIDSGSCENVVSFYMVDKLGLTETEHPDPYELTWLKKGNILKVNKRCLVQFSIGKKYHDEVWCDIIPMDAAHILLGRPWQFDRKTKHDGFRNTYSFTKDGISITLLPLDTRSTSVSDTTLFLKRAEFESCAKDSSVVFVLVVNEQNCDAQTILFRFNHCLRSFRTFFLLTFLRVYQ